jgi:hypothetical protein
MPFFPTLGNQSVTGTVSGNNIVDCPNACRLYTGAAMYFLGDYNKGTQNVYPVNSIPNYYCAVNSGPPIGHSQRPEGYNSRVFWITSTNWADGFHTQEATEEEVYTSPQSQYMHQVFNATVQCDNDAPPIVSPPVPPVVDPPPSTPPAPPYDPMNCANFQDSLTWFRLKR